MGREIKPKTSSIFEALILRYMHSIVLEIPDDLDCCDVNRELPWPTSENVGKLLDCQLPTCK